MWVAPFLSAVFIFGLLIAQSEAELAAKSWDSALLTVDSTDQVSSVAATGSGKDEFVYIAGVVTSPRGKSIGLEGLANKGITKDTERTKETYSDGFVAKIDSGTRKLVWVYRHEVGKHYSEKSKFFDVAYDTAKNRVYAVGNIKSKETRTYAPVVVILDGATGELKSTSVHDEGIQGNAKYSAVTFFEKDLYICGSDTSGNAGKNKNIDAKAGKTEGGLLISRASAETGKRLWSRQAGLSRLRDLCSGIVVSESGAELFISATVFPAGEAGKASTKTTGKVAVYSVSAAVGNMKWATEIARGKTAQDTSFGVAINNDSVFVSSAKWTDVYRGNRMNLYKLGRDTGTLLFSRETCCGQLLSKLPDGKYQSKGSAEPARGLYVGGDGFVYQVGAYRARKALGEDTFASVVVRTSIFGQQDPTSDISDPIEHFKYEAYKPLMLSAAADGLISIERSGDLTGTDAEAHNVKLIDVKLQPVDTSRQARYRAKTGEYYAQIRAKTSGASEKTTPLGAISGVVADLTRLHREQVSATIDPKDDTTVILATVYSDRPNVETSPGAHDVLRRMKEVLTASGPRASELESTMFLRAGVLSLQSTPSIVAHGKTADMGAVSAAGASDSSSSRGVGATAAKDQTKSGAASKEKSAEEKKKGLSKKAIIGIGVGAGVGLLLIITIIVAAVMR